MKYDYFYLEGTKLAFSAVSGELEKARKDSFQYMTLKVIQDWLSGKNHFSLSTSGSTGTPKLIDISRQQILESIGMSARALQLKSGYKSLIGINPGFIGGMMMIFRSLHLDMEMHIVAPSSNPFMASVVDDQIDFVALVPMQLSTILDHPESLKKFNACRAAIIGGAPVSDELIKKLQGLSVSIFATYGMTETVSHIALKPLNGSEKSDYFKTLQGVNISQDDRGCLVIEAPVTNGEKVITNDGVRIKNNSAFEWSGRIDNVVNSGGIKIQLELVEREISQLFSAEGIEIPFFLYGESDELLGQKLMMLVETDEFPYEEWNRKLKEVLGLKGPKEIKVVPSFVRTETGKINRNKTIELAN